MKKLMTLLTMIGIFTITAHFSNAQTAGTQPDTATLNFIKQASTAGMKEVKAGRLAVQKGKSASVKAFGSRMVTDHSKANTKLMKIIKSKGWQITPPSIPETDPDAMLTSSSGADFDKSYVTMMVQDHQKAVALFENAATNIADPDVKAFVQETLPTLKQHLTDIQAIAAKMNISTR
jgi:putative membrane protein